MVAVDGGIRGRAGWQDSEPFSIGMEEFEGAIQVASYRSNRFAMT